MSWNTFFLWHKVLLLKSVFLLHRSAQKQLHLFCLDTQRPFLSLKSSTSITSVWLGTGHPGYFLRQSTSSLTCCSTVFLQAVLSQKTWNSTGSHHTPREAPDYLQKLLAPTAFHSSNGSTKRHRANWQNIPCHYTCPTKGNVLSTLTLKTITIHTSTGYTSSVFLMTWLAQKVFPGDFNIPLKSEFQGVFLKLLPCPLPLGVASCAMDHGSQPGLPVTDSWCRLLTLERKFRVEG